MQASSGEQPANVEMDNQEEDFHVPDVALLQFQKQRSTPAV